MADPIAPEDYADWNEKMVRRYDPEVFYNHPRGAVRWVENKRVKAVIRGLNAKADHSVLDVGCGAGNLLERISGVREKHGVDLSATLVERAKKRLAGNATIIQADAEQLPFPDATFNGVVASSLLSHVLHPDAVVKELKRVTKPGGRIVISISDESQIERGIGWLRMLCLEGLFIGKQAAGEPTAAYHVDYHLHRFSLKRVREVVGDSLKEVRTVSVPMIFPVHSVLVYDR